MRDAIGQVFTLQIILAFVLLINGYMAYSVNYTRAFRVKNQIINYIEQYENPENEDAKAKINSYVQTMNYKVSNRLINEKQSKGYTCYKEGWCYKAFPVSTANGDGDLNGTYYAVVTFVNIDIPVINNLVGLGSFLEVVGETKTIYQQKEVIR